MTRMRLNQGRGDCALMANETHPRSRSGFAKLHSGFHSGAIGFPALGTMDVLSPSFKTRPCKMKSLLNKNRMLTLNVSLHSQCIRPT